MRCASPRARDLLAHFLPRAWAAFPAERARQKVTDRFPAAALADARGLVSTIALLDVDYGGRFFEFAEPGNGTLSIVIEVVEIENGEPVFVDLCAWPVQNPAGFATYLGRAHGLGVDRVTNPASTFAGQDLRLFRTPEAFLANGARGCCVLDPHSARRWLPQTPGRILCDDYQHALEVAQMLGRSFPPSRIAFPTSTRRAAA